MKISQIHKRKAQAFTLIEMIGVLAVIAVLAALLIPKVFEAINNSRINNAAVSYNTVKAAVADHYAKFGSLLSSNGLITMTEGSVGAQAFDHTLLTEGFIDKPFITKIGNTNSFVAATNCLGAVAADTVNQAYDLDGVGAINDALGGVVIQAVIPGVTELDAKELNDRLDGPSPALGSPILTSDTKGRVKYATGSPTTVYIYVTHR